jgi:hypothetical protein
MISPASPGIPCNNFVIVFWMLRPCNRVSQNTFHDAA